MYNVLACSFSVLGGSWAPSTYWRSWVHGGSPYCLIHTCRERSSITKDDGSTSGRELSSSFSTLPSSSYNTCTSPRRAVTIHPRTSSLQVDHHVQQNHPDLLMTTKSISKNDGISLGDSEDSGRGQMNKMLLRSQSSLQIDEKRKMFSFLEKVKADHRRSVEDKRSIAEAIERKLRFHQHERMVLEDARVARLRDQLSRTSVDEVKTTVIETLAPLSDTQLNLVIH